MILSMRNSWKQMRDFQLTASKVIKSRSVYSYKAVILQSELDNANQHVYFCFHITEVRYFKGLISMSCCAI